MPPITGVGKPGSLDGGFSHRKSIRMTLLSEVRRKFVCILMLACILMLWRRVTVQSKVVRCSMSSVGPLHLVQGLLERFEAGRGCAARESGDQETHVVAVGRATNSAENQVTVFLRPLPPPLPPPPRRALILVLSSRFQLHWWLEAEDLPPEFPVLVQVSSNSTVQTHSLSLRVQQLHSLPFHPRKLLHWTQKHHGSLSSLTRTPRANRVYLRLGEDPTLPKVCKLQSLFLSPNYLTSDLQAREVRGCVLGAPQQGDVEVHVIKLHSVGSTLCGSLQVEVIVSLLPPVANLGTYQLVLVLSSLVPVNWAFTASGLRGHISVHSSNSVSPLHPPRPYLTMSSVLNSELSSTPDLLAWTNDRGFTNVTSYTEADLANRFVIHLAGGQAEVVPSWLPVVVQPPWAEERRLGPWLSDWGQNRGGEPLTVQCRDGHLSVALDRHILQTLSISEAMVTLRDPRCQAQSNGSHFLLAFPVISCGTEGIFLGQPRAVQYRNMVFIWRQKAQTHNETTNTGPFGIQVRCLAVVPTPASPLPDAAPTTGLLPTLRRQPGPVLTLRLFVTEDYEQRRTGPCVIIADHRVYVEVSVKGDIKGAVELRSCVVSPVSDSRKSPFWRLIKDGCSTDPSLVLSKMRGKEEVGNRHSEEEEAARRTGRGGAEEDGHERATSVAGDVTQDGGVTQERTEAQAEEEMHSSRFSFVLRPVYREPMQFLHCTVRLCAAAGDGSVEEAAGDDCPGGLSIPRLVAKSPGQGCEFRNLSRPMLVTRSLSALAARPPPDSLLTRSPAISQLASPSPEHSGSAVETGPVILIVFAAFIMGIGLMGVLWCIYTHTGTKLASDRGNNLLMEPQASNSSHGNWDPEPMPQANSCV